MSKLVSYCNGGEKTELYKNLKRKVQDAGKDMNMGNVHKNPRTVLLE
jgi:hypothetical protein